MPTIQTQKFVRTPLYAEAVRVTEDNMADLAKWCSGDIRSTAVAKYIKVRVYRPLNDRQTQAFAGDWIVVVGKGFKVYPNSAFEKSFKPVVDVSDATGEVWVDWDIDANKPVEG
jgi:hypothetical protein